MVCTLAADHVLASVWLCSVKFTFSEGRLDGEGAAGVIINSDMENNSNSFVVNAKAVGGGERHCLQ